MDARESARLELLERLDSAKNHNIAGPAPILILKAGSCGFVEWRLKDVSGHLESPIIDHGGDIKRGGKGRVYGGGLHKLEPKELANVSADFILSALPHATELSVYRQQKLFAE